MHLYHVRRSADDFKLLYNEPCAVEFTDYTCVIRAAGTPKTMGIDRPSGSTSFH